MLRSAFIISDHKVPSMEIYLVKESQQLIVSILLLTFLPVWGNGSLTFEIDLLTPDAGFFILCKY